MLPLSIDFVYVHVFCAHGKTNKEKAKELKREGRTHPENQRETRRRKKTVQEKRRVTRGLMSRKTNGNVNEIQ